MSVIEVHPEELLDRELRGELTERERELLMAHLARCAPCRFERLLRADFEVEHRSPLPASDLTDAIAGALRACDLPASAATASSQPAAAAAVGSRYRWGKRVAMLLVACGVFGLGVGYAGAQLGLTQGGFGALLERVGVRVAHRPQAKPVRSQALRAPKPSAARSQVVTAAAAPAQLPPAAVSAPVVQPDPRPTPAVVAPAGAVEKRSLRAPLPRSRAAMRASRAHAPSVSSVALPAPAPTVERVTSTSSAVEPISSGVLSVNTQPVQQASGTTSTSVTTNVASAPVDTSSRLFERANRARHRGASGEASILYEELRQRYPDSAEARLSLAVSARMCLDQGELRDALSGFDAYLAAGDRSLHEEAMVGRIRALERMGRERDAQLAAEALLRAHPRSAFRPEAEALIAGSERD